MSKYTYYKGLLVVEGGPCPNLLIVLITEHGYFGATKTNMANALLDGLRLHEDLVTVDGPTRAWANTFYEN